MCQTGGPRCYNSAKKSADKAEEAFRASAARFQAISDESVAASYPSASAWQTAWKDAHLAKTAAQAALMDEFADLAATRQGAVELKSRSEDPSDAVVRAMSLPEIAREADFRRRRGALTRAVRERHFMDNLYDIVGKTGEARVDALVEQAARNMALKPEAFKGYRHTLPDVVPFETDTQKATMIASWTAAVQRKAEEYEIEQRRGGHAARDVAMISSTVEDNPQDLDAHARLDFARKDLADCDDRIHAVASDLVMTAQKLLTAYRQEVSAPAAA